MHGVIHRHHELKLRCKIAQGASWPSWFVTRLPMLYGSRYNVSIDNAVYKPAINMEHLVAFLQTNGVAFQRNAQLVKRYRLPCTDSECCTV